MKSAQADWDRFAKLVIAVVSRTAFALVLGIGVAPAADQQAGSSDQLDEIVVSAQKRTEDIKDVPISISVLSGDQLKQQQITSLDDLARSVPDLTNTGAAGGPGQGNYEIRGVSGTGGNSIGQATVGIYLDDVSMTVPTGTTAGATELKFFDIDHVEVLRGPQGTLYGASSMGGTIRFISNQPDLSKFGGSALTELSDTEHGGLNYVEQGVINLPISTGVLAVRIGAQYTENSGYINVENPANPGQVTYKGLNDDRATQVRTSIKYQSPSSDLTIVPAILVQRETFGGTPSYDLDTPLETPAYITPRSFDNSLIPSLTIEKSVLGATLTSASSYFQRESNVASDSTFINEAPLTNGAVLWPTIFNLPNNVHQYSEELRLTSKSMQESGLPISWIAGVYLAQQVDDTYADLHTLGSTADYYQALNNAGYGSLAEQLATYSPDNDLFSQYTHYEVDQSSLFGEFNYSPVSRWTITAGLRELIAHQSATEYVGGYYQWFGDNGGTTVEPGATKSHTLTPKVALRYDYSDTSSVYANAVQGFRLGGVNGPVPLSPGCLYSLNQIGLNSAPLSYSPDKLWSYELGTKSSFFSNRLSVDASAFYITWNKVQQGINLPGSPTDVCASGFVTNAGEAVSDGVDLDLRAKVTTHLTLSAAGNVTRAVITQPAPDTGTVVGSHLEGVPMWTADLGANYSAPITDSLADFAAVDMDWIGRSYGVFAASSPAYDYPAYVVLNASVGVAIGDVQLSLFAKNVLNENKDIQPGAVPNSTPAGTTYYTGTIVRPRTVGVNASIKF
jgi:iron complex outermembrane receptor protein